MKHTIKAMTDLLFEVQDTCAKIDKINSALADTQGYEDFSTFIAPMNGRIEYFLSGALDLFFEEITGHEPLASFMLYDSGKQIWNGVDYNLKNRESFDAFIAASTKKKILSINNGETP